MKKFIKSLLILMSIGLISCSDVIDVEVPTATERLVIEASLDWQKGTTGNNQTIKLSTSTPYFDTTINNIVVGASVKVTNVDSNVEYIFTDQNDGTYTISNFVPVVNNTYTLEVLYNDEIYKATETLVAVPAINGADQSLEGGFDDEVLDVSIYWNDPIDEENFYFIRFSEEQENFPDLSSISDEFSNGNEMDYFFENDKEDDDGNPTEFLAGDVVDIELYGVSEGYYNYISLLIDQYYAGGDPFSSVPAELRGNCINLTNESNYAFGFFRLSEYDTLTYTFE
ncbi:uncharacterized protein DUF4249 [Winogradskyella eximia]|jgi:Domain of unknown function (DUF4249)|uniref:Uncharacterized protein DUF4249 n=1 Tax=Winogradskyella eximia TaxID=262006 RepID=A0A3D9HA51_9FLAO|nr:DUF4249 domain-containing protein [Winogradskyella eximia]RED46365.1 uncharacterized protein DUF4249 [Winogradskyella eximia]